MTGGVPQTELISIQRSAAMIQPRATYPVERELLMTLITEVLEQRQLLARLGADLKAVASHAPKPLSPNPDPTNRQVPRYR